MIYFVAGEVMGRAFRVSELPPRMIALAKERAGRNHRPARSRTSTFFTSILDTAC